MNTQQEQLYALAEELAGYNAMSLKAMAQAAFEHSGNKTAMKTFSFCWGRNARSMAKAVKLWSYAFDSLSGTSAGDLLALFAIASTNQFERGMLYDDWRNKSLTYYEVLERVKQLKTPKPRTPKAKVCAKCEEADKLISRYATHQPQCMVPMGDCTCGYENALADWRQL